MKFFRTVKGRLLASIFVIHALLMGLVMYDLVERQHSFMEEQLSKNAHALASLLASNAALPMQNYDVVALGDLLEDIRVLPDVSMIFVMDTTDRVRASYPPEYISEGLDDPISREMVHGLAKSNKDAYQRVHDGLTDTIHTIKIDGRLVGYCRILMTNTTMLQELQIMTRKGLMYILFAIVMGVFLAWFVIRRMAGQITVLSEAAAQLAQKNFDVEIPQWTGEDEIAKMGQGFRVMIDSIRSHVNSLSEIGKNRLLQSQRYQKALLDWAKLDYKNSRVAIRKATEIAAKTLEIGRVSVWKFSPDGSMIVCSDLYNEQEHAHAEGAILYQKDFPLYFEALQRGGLIVAKDAQNDPITHEFAESYLKPLGIFSMLDVPIVQEGHVVGVVCHECIGKMKEWQPEEQDFALAMASTVALSLEIERRREVEDRLAYRADHDELTELPNRRLFLDRLDQAIRHAHRAGSQVAVLFIDLDHFKEINDSLGHLIGDEVLIHVARLMQTHLRDVDTIARLGGDEFSLIIDSLEDVERVSAIAAKLVSLLQQPICIDKRELYVTSSIGISVYPGDGIFPETLLRNADSAMYKAKTEGRNSYQFYTEDMTERALERVAMEASLRRALDHEEFRVYYQPQVDGVSGRLIGMEALIRWEHPEHGLVSPAKFIPLAVETGLIILIDRYVMQAGMRQLKQWVDEGLNPGILALNLTIKQLKQDDFIPVLQSMLQENGCLPQWIELEVSEGEVMEHPEQAIKILRQISDLGIQLAIDDFGTGHSSLAYLKRLPVDKLKIDQSFIRDIPKDEDDMVIVQAIIALAKSLHLDIIAEGVETEEQKEFLTENGCLKIQGYLYGRPMKAEDMHEMLKDKTDRATTV